MPTLKLTDGTTTIDFGNVTTGNYRLHMGGYTPKVNGLRLANIGGRGIYDEVEETITFDVVDTTAGGCYTRLATLTKLLLQTNRFARGEAVTAVKLQYSPDGATTSSSGSPLEALVVGTPDDNPAGIGLAPTIDQTGYQYMIEGVSITVRRSVWILGSEAQTSSSTNSGTIASLTFAADVPYLSPTDAIYYLYMGREVPQAFFVLGSGSSSIQVVAAADTTGSPSGTGYSYAADANQPRNGSTVMRYTPVSTSESFSRCFNKISLTEGKRYSVLVSVRNNSATTSFGIRIGILYAGYVYTALYTEQRTVSPSTGPAWISLGTFVSPVSGTADVTPELALIASAASGSIDVDSIAIVETDSATILGMTNMQKVAASGTQTDGVLAYNRYTSALSFKQTSIHGATAATHTNIVTGGDILSRGTAVRAVLLATLSTYWKQYIGGSVHQTQFALTRYRVYLSPE